MYYIMLLNVLLVLALLIIVLFFKCNGLKYYHIKSKQQGPKTLFIGSTHGNEPAGYFALRKFVESNPDIKRGQIKVIPALNACGLALNQRKHPLGDYDINRSYPNKTYLTTHLLKFINEADWIIDLHEGWGFHKLNPRSVGSGVYPGNTKQAKLLSKEVVDLLNTTIKEPHKQFVTFNLPNILTSLRDYCNKKEKHYILVETSGINDIQPLQIRVDQQTKIIQHIVNNLHNK